jgi:hypothetical protein
MVARSASVRWRGRGRRIRRTCRPRPACAASGDGEHQVGGGDAFLQLAGQLEADDFGDQHRDRLAEHRRLRLDAADAPAEHAEAVDHRGVAVGADAGVGIGDGLAVLASSRSTPSARGIRGSPGGRCRCPAARRGSCRTPSGPSAGSRSAPCCARIRARRSSRRLRAWGAEFVDHHRVVDDEVDGHQRVDLLGRRRPASPSASRIAARSTTAGTPVKVLHQHARRAVPTPPRAVPLRRRGPPTPAARRLSRSSSRRKGGASAPSSRRCG